MFVTRIKGLGKKAPLVFIAMVFIVSSFFSLLAPVVEFTNAQSPTADQLERTTSVAEGKDLDWQIKSMLYYRMMSKCLDKSMLLASENALFLHTSRNRITSEGSTSGKWFTNATGYVEGAFGGPYLYGEKFDDDDRYVEAACSSWQFVKNALKLWGITGDEALCSFGFNRSNQDDEAKKVSQCTSSQGGTGDFERTVSGRNSAEKFNTWIRTKIYGGTMPDYTDKKYNAFWYTYYLKVFQFSTCGYKSDGTGGPNPNVKANYDDKDATDVYKINRVGANGLSLDGGETYWLGGDSRGTVIDVRPNAPYDIGKVTKSCREIENHINNLAPSYAAALSENPELSNNDDAQIDNDVPAQPTEDDAEESVSSCVIEGVGWIICPVFNFLAGVADSTYGLIKGLLETRVEILSTDGATYRAWSAVRTLANVGFVITFLIIIFSQLTGMGVSNYGVKKLIPRIIIAAILVNISFLVTQLAVDLSNILGGSLKGFLESIPTGDGSKSEDFFATGNVFTNVAFGIFSGQMIIGGLIGAGVLAAYAGPSLLIPIVLAAVLAIVITLFILIARQAIIILLVVLSPLAFLAMLLPNTENIFKQWRKMFVALLLIYPAISLLFGASHLAAAVLLDAFSATDDLFGQLIAMAVLVLPLFLVPSLVQNSLKAIPVIGSFASKMASRANGMIGKQSKSGFARSTFGQSMNIRRKAKDRYRMQQFAKNASQPGLANILAKEPAFTKAQKYANQSIDRTATLMANKEREEDIQAAELKLASMKYGRKETRAVALNMSPDSDSAIQAAGIRDVVRSNDVKGMADLWDQSRTWEGARGEEMRGVLAKSMEAASGRPAAFGAGAIAQLKLGSHDSSKDTIIKAVKDGVYSPAKISTADKDELHAVSEIVDASKDPTLLPIQQKLVNDANAALNDTDLRRTMGKNLERIISIRNGESPKDKLE